MSDDQKTTAQPKKPEPMLKVRVLKTGTRFNGIKAAKGLITSLEKSKAHELKEVGLVEVIGV